MSNRRDTLVLMLMVFISGNIVVTGISLLLGEVGRTFWLIGQGILLVTSAMVAALAIGAKHRD